jgi:hypothetical protein
LKKYGTFSWKPITGYPGVAIRVRTSCMLYAFMEVIVETPDQIRILE